MSEADLTLFAHVAARAESELDLARAALLIAEPEYPGLDVSRYLQRLDELGAQAGERLAAGRTAAPPLLGLAAFLYGELGFAGNQGDYYDPRNSFLNEVLDRKTGIPITLAVVLIEAGRRAGIPVEGVGFPGHFLVRARGPAGTLLLDPFTGQPCDRARLRALTKQVTGDERDPEARYLEPVTKRAILVRMLNNLRNVYGAAGDGARLRAVLERLSVLQPSDELDAELATLARPRPTRPRVLN
jgi:regulator of sirC expression with transglutaminase-like and TPR domain